MIKINLKAPDTNEIDIESIKSAIEQEKSHPEDVHYIESTMCVVDCSTSSLSIAGNFVMGTMFGGILIKTEIDDDYTPIIEAAKKHGLDFTGDVLYWYGRMPSNVGELR